MTHLGAFSPIEYPTRTTHIKIWVERHAASTHATQRPSPGTRFVSKTAFILRLRKLIDIDDEDDDEDEDSMASAREPIRAVQGLPEGYAELYTTLDAANRAARRLQIEMSHEKDPDDEMESAWQEQDARRLEREGAEGDGYWVSRFNSAGRGGDRYEVLVEKARLSGPRNL